MNRNCTNCGAQVPDGAIICPACGAAAHEPTAPAQSPFMATPPPAPPNPPMPSQPYGQPAYSQNQAPPPPAPNYGTPPAPNYGTPPPPQYGAVPPPPAPYYPVPMEKKVPPTAIASLVVSLVGLFIFALPAGVVAVSLAGTTMARFDPNTQKLKGMAIAGLVIGIIDILFWLISIVMF